MRTFIYLCIIILHISIYSKIQANTYNNISNVSHVPFVPMLFENTVDPLFHNIGLNSKTVYNKRQRHSKVTNGTGVPALHTTEKSVVVQAGNLSTAGSGFALNLSGSNDYISIPDAPELQFGSQNFTVEFWIKLNSTPTDNNNIIIGKWDDSGNEGNNEWAFGLGSNSVPYFVVESGYSQTYRTFDTPLQVGQWYFITGTRGGAFIAATLNGLNMGSISIGSETAINTTSLPVIIGNSNSSTNDIDITIDEVRIWSPSLPNAHIREWMCKKISGDSHTHYNSMVLHYHFDEGSGPDINDNAIVGNPNQGIPFGNPQWVTSGAPIGDESMHNYSMSPFGNTAQFFHPDGDFVEIQFTDGPAACGAQIYRINQPPNITTPPDGFSGFNADRYYGVFVTIPDNSFWEYRLTYGYEGTPFENTNDAQIAFRENNADDTWENVNGTPDDYLNTFTAQYRTASGEYIIEGEAGTSCSNLPTNNVTLSASSDLCDGDTLTLSADAGYNYLWSTGATSQSITIETADIYTVTVSDDMGCSAISEPVTVTIKNLINDFLTPNQLNYLLQATDVATVDFSATTNGTIINYNWDFGDGNISTDATPSHTYSEPGFYTVTLTVIDNENCGQSLVKTDYINVWSVFPSSNVSPTGVTQNITGASFTDAYSGCISIQNGNGSGGGGYVCITSDGTNWTPAGTISTGSDLTSIYLIDGLGYITGTNGLICVYNAGNWTQFDTGTSAPFYNCWFGSADYGWSVGGNGTICIYDGTNWTATPTGVTNNFYSVWGYGTNTWAVGSGGVICVYSSTGWEQQSSGVTAQLNGVYFVNNLIGYACGNGGTIVGTTNGGSTWNTLQAEGSLAWNLNAIWAIDTNNIIAVGDNGVVCISTNGGATWDLLSIGTQDDLLDVTVNNCTGYCTGSVGAVYQFPFPGCTPALSIELVDFEAIENNKTVYLKWQTATETDIAYFIIERSDDGGWFERLGQIQGAGTTNLPQNYTFTDRSPQYGLNYYRLKQVDTDGQFTYSSVISVLIESQPHQIVLFPNPVTEKASLIYHSPENTILKFLISDEAGRWIASPTFNVHQGQNILELDVRDLSPAVYFLSLENDGVAIQFLIE